MAVSIATLIASGLPVIGAINTFLTGVARKEYVEMEFTDYAGVTSKVVLEIEPAFGGGAQFDVLSVDLLNALADVAGLSSAELNSIRFVSEVRDHTPVGADAESNCKERAQLAFTVAGDAVRSVSIPSVRDDLVLAGSKNALDLANADLQNAIAEFTGEGLTTRTFALDNRQASGCTAGKRVTYKS